MRKIISTILLVTIFLSAQSQDIRLGIKGGLNLANEKTRSGNFSFKGTSVGSFHAGFLLDLPLSENLYLQPQLLFTGKGSREQDLIFRPYYIELPVNLLYKLPVNRSLSLYGGFGPGIAIGITGNVKDLDNNISRKLVFGETNNSDYKTADITGGFELGAEINNKAGFGAGYRWSFADVTRGSAKITHQVVNFSFFYFFGESRKTKKPSTSNNRTGTGTRTSTRRNR